MCPRVLLKPSNFQSMNVSHERRASNAHEVRLPIF
jgi:hypothetical protein